MQIAFNIGDKFFNGNNPYPYYTSVGAITTAFLNNAISIAGVIFIFLIIFAGYKMIAGAGGQNPAMFASGQKTLTAAIIGFILVIFAYWMVNLLQTSLGTSILY